jgi:hypothetical protein
VSVSSVLPLLLLHTRAKGYNQHAPMDDDLLNQPSERKTGSLEKTFSFIAASSY